MKLKALLAAALLLAIALVSGGRTLPSFAQTADPSLYLDPSSGPAPEASGRLSGTGWCTVAYPIVVSGRGVSGWAEIGSRTGDLTGEFWVSGNPGDPVAITVTATCGRETQAASATFRFDPDPTATPPPTRPATPTVTPIPTAAPEPTRSGATETPTSRATATPTTPARATSTPSRSRCRPPNSTVALTARSSTRLRGRPEITPTVTPGSAASASSSAPVVASITACCGVGANGISVPSRSIAAMIEVAEAKCCHSA